jgi:hypothetical protein
MAEVLLVGNTEAKKRHPPGVAGMSRGILTGRPVAIPSSKTPHQAKRTWRSVTQQEEQT